MKRLLAIGVILLFVGMSVSSSGFNLEKQSTIAILGGNTLYVGGNGTGNYTKIQDAINDASDGDTVFVYNGTYYENLNVSKSINLIGENKDTTIIDGSHGDADVVKFPYDAEPITLSHFTIRNASAYGIHILSDFNIVNENIFENKGKHQITLWDGEHNIIKDNLILNSSHGIHLAYASNNNIFNNTIINCSWMGIVIASFSHGNLFSNNYLSESENIGISLSRSSRNLFIGNTIRKCKKIGIELSHPHENIFCCDNNFTKNVIMDNEIAIQGEGAQDNLFYQNQIDNNTYGVFSIENHSDVIYRNTFTNNLHDACCLKTLNSLRTTCTWDENFWNRPRILPYPILGRLIILNLVEKIFQFLGFLNSTGIQHLGHMT